MWISGAKRMKTTSRARLGAVVAMLFYVACSGGDTGRSPGGGRDDGRFGGRGDEPTERVTRGLVALRPNIAPPAPLHSEGVVAPSGTGSVGADGAFNYTLPNRGPTRSGRDAAVAGAGLLEPARQRSARRRLGVGRDLGDQPLRQDSRFGGRAQSDPLRFHYRSRCVDGQRLVPVAANENQVGAEYRTEGESFTRVKIAAMLSGAPYKWTAEFKDGRIAEYGIGARDLSFDPSDGDPWSPRITLTANGTQEIRDGSTISTWPLANVRDRWEIRSCGTTSRRAPPTTAIRGPRRTGRREQRFCPARSSTPSA